MNVHLLFQLEDFTESEYRLLCDHLGHTPDVHKRYYRLRDTTTELTKVAKMLLKADQAGNTLIEEESAMDVKTKSTIRKRRESNTSNTANTTQKLSARKPGEKQQFMIFKINSL